MNRSKMMGWMLGTTVVFNLIDAVLTLLLTKFGLAVEANPLMAIALEVGSLPFVVAKLLVVSFGVWALWRHRTHIFSFVGTAIIFVIYGALMVYHLHSVETLVKFLG